MILELIGKRPRVESPAAVMIHEIGLGLGPSLVAEVRTRAALPDSADRRPSGVRYPDLCPRCSGLRHDPLPCRDDQPAAPRQRPVPGPPLMAAVPAEGKAHCRYDGCPGRAEPVNGDGYHPSTCAYLAAIKPDASARTPARVQPEAS